MYPLTIAQVLIIAAELAASWQTVEPSWIVKKVSAEWGNDVWTICIHIADAAHWYAVDADGTVEKL